MSNEAPTIIAIDHDDYHAADVGRTEDGRQFFLTTPFEPRRDDTPGAEFVAIYVFDGAGKLVEALIDNLGPRATMDSESRRAMCEKRIDDLGPIKRQRIEIEPFSVTRFDTEFGLIASPPEDEDDIWRVEMQPGNFMAFFEPWDSGEYDT